MNTAASDLKWLFTARALRDFGDGFVTVLLPVYLLSLGLTAFQVGVFATTALLGSSLLTLGVGALGGRHDHRRLLVAAAIAMSATGIAFSIFEHHAVLFLVAFVGTVNPSGGSVSVFVPLEHAVLAGRVADRDRTTMFARYSLAGALAGAVGTLAAASPDYLAALGIDQPSAIKAMFVLYAVLGLAAGAIYGRLAPRPVARPAEAATLLGPSRRIVYRLAALFCIDSFAGGFLVQSLLALWLFERFGMSLSAAGLFFFWSGVLSAFSFPVAARLARRFGLVNTMVFTHLPSSLCLILAAFASSLPVVLGLLLLRSALSQMDVPTRSSFVMAVVTERERAAAASFTSVPRSLASAISPSIAGALFGASLHAWPLLLCGGLKIVYDLLLLAECRRVKLPEEH